MGLRLCTAEKPSVAKDIARVVGADTRRNGYFEGNGFLVTWAIGHLVGLAEPPAYGFVPQMQIYGEGRQQALSELPLIPGQFQLIVLEATKDQFRVVRDLMHRDDVDLVIDCGDMGSEGHILQWFIREMAACDKPVKRFCATSMTDEAIRAAMGNLRPIEDFANIIKGEFCKKKADWITGMSMSRAASLKYNAGISVGRVQSPTLYFIVRRYVEVSNFKVTDYYTMVATLAEGFRVFWNKDTSGLFPQSIKSCEGHVLDRDAVERTAQEISRYGTGVISNFVTQKKAIDRPQLFDITELQRVANRKYGYTAAVTLATAQALYETHKVLSYPRTDSRYITSDLQPYMKTRVRVIGSIAKYAEVVNLLLSQGLNIDKKIVDDSKVQDHHALIPTEKIDNFNMNALVPTPEEKKKGVTQETLQNILDLVLCRMLEAFSKPYIFEQTNVSVTFPNGFVFTANGKKPISLGWRATHNTLQGKESDEDEESGADDQIFPNITQGQTVNVCPCSVLAKKTTPPKLHTEGTLLTEMENAGASIENGSILKGKGIGTQATRAEIIKKLFDQGVVETVKKGKTNYIQPTSKGLGVIRVLPAEIYSPKITADWESLIAGISAGKNTEKDFFNMFLPFIRSKVQEVKDSTAAVTFKKEREVFGVCPWCGGDVYRYDKKDEKDKVESEIFFCSERCGFNLSTADQTFAIYLGRGITRAEAVRFIAKKFLVLDVKKKNGDGTYRGEFTFKERFGKGGKKYCNIQCERVHVRK